MNPTVKTLGLTAALGLVLTAGAAADGGAKGDGARSDLAKLKGTWVREMNGKTYIVTFNGGEVRDDLRVRGGDHDLLGNHLHRPDREAQAHGLEVRRGHRKG